MNKKIIVLISILTSFTAIYSQAGRGVYQFLDLPISSRLAGMGGTNISLHDNDINFAFQNPALLTAETHNVIGLNMANYMADIKFGSAVYGRTFGCDNYTAIGIQFVDYGTFKKVSELNVVTPGDEKFTAKDFAISIIYSRPINDKISVGGTLKPVYSVFERYTSYGVALDAGVNYSSGKLFSAGMVFRNFGTQLKGYYSDEDGQHLEALPFDIQLGMTYKLAHAPLRFSLTFQGLQQWDLSYQSTNQPASDLNTTLTNTDISFIDMAFRHTLMAVEFVPNKNFYLTMAYNHRRQKEMAMSGFKSGPGFSFGGGLKLSKYHVGFGITQFQVGNTAYQFSISTSLTEFKL